MKISFITSTRADFGLLKNLILEVKKNKRFKVSVIASGTHFSKKFGKTFKEIEKIRLELIKELYLNQSLILKLEFQKSLVSVLKKLQIYLKKIILIY